MISHTVSLCGLIKNSFVLYFKNDVYYYPKSMWVHLHFLTWLLASLRHANLLAIMNQMVPTWVGILRELSLSIRVEDMLMVHLRLASYFRNRSRSWWVLVMVFCITYAFTLFLCKFSFCVGSGFAQTFGYRLASACPSHLTSPGLMISESNKSYLKWESVIRDNSQQYWVLVCRDLYSQISLIW